MEPPTPDIRQYFHDWLDRDGFPLWPYWAHVRSWWDLRDRPNVLLLHFADLKQDLPGQIRRIARFLELGLDEASIPGICARCSFGYMQSNAASLTPVLRQALKGGANTFFHRGEGGGWRELLTPQDIAKYEGRMREELTPDCAKWMTCGSIVKTSTD
jgi:aryl sulfotransferase